MMATSVHILASSKSFYYSLDAFRYKSLTGESSARDAAAAGRSIWIDPRPASKSSSMRQLGCSRQKAEPVGCLPDLHN